MVPHFTISAAGEDDYDSVFALHEQLFRTHIEQIWGWHQDWQRENFSNNWKQCDTRVIESHRELIRYVQTFQYPDHIFLKNLGLLPPHQSKGIGLSIMQDLQAKATALGLPIRLSVFTTNPRAQRFYERIGSINESRTAEFQHVSWTGHAASRP